MALVRPNVVVLAMTACAVIGLSGCVTDKRYRLSSSPTPPAVSLNYVAAVPALELRLVTVIVYQGPGSWKQQARWDEYGVSLTNRRAEPVAVESVAVVDWLGVEQWPGGNPWRLEELSEAHWEKYTRLGGKLVMGVGAVGAMELAAIGYGLTGGAVSGVFFAMPAVLVADVVVVGVMNHRNKDKVEKEFDRRRLALPLSLAPGATSQGSFFFPMIPGPQRLILKGRADGVPFELMLDLKPLAGLHLKPEGKK